MGSQPDKLFRDKLGNYRHTAPPAAWERIERNVAQPTAYITFAKIAASIIVIAAVYLLWTLRLTPNVQDEIISDQHVQPVEIINQEKEIVNHDEKAITTNDERAQISVKKERNISIPSREAKPAEGNASQKADAVEPIVEESVTLTVDSEVEQVVADTEDPMQDKSQAVTIVYTANDVNSKFLREKETKVKPAVVADPPKEERPNTSFVYVIKQNEFGLGDLRQIKDELLTLEFLAHNDRTDKDKK